MWDNSLEREWWRHKCLNSFWWFFRYAWGYDFNPKGAANPKGGWLFEDTHKAACDWFEGHALRWLADRRAGLGRQLKLIIVVPRDWGKTTLFTQAGQAWLHLHDPELATYTGAETITRAKEVLGGIKAVISGDDKHARYAWLYGNQKHPGRTWKTEQVVTAARTNLTRRDASFGTWAVQSGMVGLHPDGCFFDDPNTYEQMKRKADWLTVVNQHLDTLIPVFQSDAIWCLTGTRYGDGDHIGRSLRTEGVASVGGMSMPGVVPTPDGTWHLFFMDAEDDRYPESDARHFVMPRIWDLPRINSLKKRNPTKYYAQVRNNPTRSPYNPLTYDLCTSYIVKRDTIDIKKLRVSLHLDTSFKRPERRSTGDCNVIAAVGHTTDGSGKCVFLGADASTNWTSTDFDKALIENVKRWRAQAARVACLTDEEEIGGKPGIWEAHLNNIFRSARVQMPDVHIISHGNTKAKPHRLHEAASLWRDGRMMLLEDAPGLDELIDQMCKIGMTEHDDHADAVADCFHKLVYRSVYLNDTIRHSQTGNPFDDVLKPGPVGEQAAETIAKMWDERQQWEHKEWDVVQP